MSAGGPRGYMGRAQPQAVQNDPHGNLSMENARLRTENARLRAERDAVRVIVLQRDASLGSLSAEIDSLRGQLTAQLELNEKQKRTIKLQSTRIGGPAETNNTTRVDLSASTSFNYHVGQPRRPIGFLPPPLPPLGLTNGHYQVPRPPDSAFLPPPAPLPASAYRRRGSQQAVAPLEAVGAYDRRGSHQPVAPYGISMPSTSRQGSIQMTTSRCGSVQPSTAPYQQHPLPLRPPSVVASQALITQNTADSPVNWSNEFSTFFALTEAWARNFCNVPTPVDDLPLALLRSLRAYSSPSIASTLLSSSGTRYFLVAAAVNHWITSDIFRFHIVQGFSDSYDATLQADLHRQVAHNQSSSTNLTLRRALAQATADDVHDLMAEPEFATWLSSVVTSKTNNLWNGITSLLAPSAIHVQAYEELTHVFREALRIGYLMLSHPAHFDVEYPTARPVTWFDVRCMQSRDPHIHDSPSRLQRHGRKITLAFTPCITVVDLLQHTVRAEKVVKSGVLLAAE